MIRNAGKVSSTTWAAVAAAAAGSSAAGAADLAPYAKAPLPVPVSTWQGFYVGGSVGASWLHSTQDDTGAVSGITSAGYGNGIGFSTTTGGSSSTANALSWLGGLNLGYNFQSGNFVYGAEADFSWLGKQAATSNGSFVNTSGYAGTYNGLRTHGGATMRSSTANELATFRARFGVDFNGTLPYLTAGLALGNLTNSFAVSGAGYSNRTASAAVSQQSWVPGLVVGGGIEHKLSERWTLRGEIMWVGFQDKQLNNPLSNTYAVVSNLTSTAGPIKFSNELTTAKIGLNYRF
jgi:outer membrane immunogenic protein